MARDHVDLDLDGREVRFSNPDKVFFPGPGHTKLDLCEYYLAVADGCLRNLRDRPTSMKRFPNGAGGDFFFQKRGEPKRVQPSRGRGRTDRARISGASRGSP
jgi:DNA primase